MKKLSLGRIITIGIIFAMGVFIFLFGINLFPSGEKLNQMMAKGG